jgi:hypothetical protein
MDIEQTNSITAIIVLREKSNNVAGGAPIFIVENQEELEKTSSLLARLTLGMVHDLGNGINIIIKH